jgi:outer membrane protein TolC
MEIKHLLPAGLLFFSCFALQAQEQKILSLDEAINLAVTQSTEAGLAETKVVTSGLDVDNVKNNRYPDFKLSGQYQRLTSPVVKLRLPTGDGGSSSDGGETATASPEVNQVMLGQASFGLPVFSGFRLKNNIEASEDIYKAETFNALNTKEQVALQTIMLYVNLYKAQESVKLIQENLKSANQRVTDFTAMEQNGLLARNDLLKAQLQSSNIELSLEDAKRRVSTLSFQLATLLKLPKNIRIVPDSAYFNKSENITPAISEGEAIAQRTDLEALRWQQKASEANIKVARADYYPSVQLMAGYVALDIQNVAQVYNAVNFGVGVSYDISNIFKNSKKVKAAQSRAEETRQAVELLTDRVKIQVQEALENYNLAIKQDKVYTQAVQQANENYRIVKDKYDNGLVDTNDLLEADVQQLQAQLNEAFSKADITQRYYELLNASGKLTNSFNLTQNK